MTTVDELKSQGNALLQSGEAKSAAVAFTKALQMEPANKFLLSNRSVAFLKMGRASRALQDADAALALDGAWIKAHFRRLQAQIAMNVAAEDLLSTARAALKIDPSAAEFVAIIKKYDPVDYKANYHVDAAPLPPTPPIVPPQSQPVSVIDPSFVQNPKFITAPNVPAVVLEFSRKTVDEVLQQFEETVAGKVPVHLAKLQSTVFFLPVADIPLPVINVSEAFSSPEMLAQCVQFLREAAQRDQILGSCSVVQRSSIAFPQVWKGRAKSDFPFDESTDGIFITIESATTEGAVEFVGQRIVHFMPMVPDANGVVHFSRDHVVALDPDWCALMPRLLK